VGRSSLKSPASAKLLPRKFFDRDPRIVAPDLLGKLIVRQEGRKLISGRIVELEAYLAPMTQPLILPLAGRHAMMFSGDLPGTRMFTSSTACITA